MFRKPDLFGRDEGRPSTSSQDCWGTVAVLWSRLLGFPQGMVVLVGTGTENKAPCLSTSSSPLSPDTNSP